MLTTIARYLIQIVPDSSAAWMTQRLAARTRKLPASPAQQRALTAACRIHYGPNKNVAWSWGAGRPVLFVHGWGGRAAQLAPLAQEIATLGFRAVALDVTGHGDSPQRHTKWAYFLQDISDLTTALGEAPYACVGHSAGALSMMAARNLKGLRAQRYACVCAPSYPFPPIRAVKKRLHPRDAVMERYKQYIADQFQTTWPQLEAGSAWLDASAQLLLFYDESDRFVSHTEGDKIKRLYPTAQLIKTNAYSHQQILDSPDLKHALAAFLSDTPVNRVAAYSQGS